MLDRVDRISGLSLMALQREVSNEEVAYSPLKMGHTVPFGVERYPVSLMTSTDLQHQNGWSYPPKKILKVE